MKLTAILILAAAAAHAEPRLVEVPEEPDAFMPIQLSKVWWGENTAEGDKARELCGSEITFVGWKRDDANRLVHVARCEE